MGRVVFSLPELGEGIHEGEVVKWLVDVGAFVEEDTPLVEVQNDKAVVEIPSPYTGVVHALLAREGETVTVGEPLLELDVQGEAETEKTEKTGEQPHPTDASYNVHKQPCEDEHEPPKSSDESTAPDMLVQEERGEKRRVLAMPSVRKYAREHGVDLETIAGSGPYGRILRQDVENVLMQRKEIKDDHAKLANIRLTTEQSGEGVKPQNTNRQGVQVATSTRHEGADAVRLRERSREPFIGTRRLIAEAMVRSVMRAPHVTLMDDVEVSALVDLRTRFKEEGEQRGLRLTYLPFIMKAVAGALKVYPYLNATLDEERQEIVTYADVHIGVAVDAPRGLVVPVVRDVPRLSIWEIAIHLQEFLKQAREGSLKPKDMKGGTFSISNLGSQGGSFFTPIIYYPQVAILGIGRIKEGPVVHGERLTVGSLLPLSLSFDHRVIDGAMAQAFLNQIKRMLSDPLLMLMEG
ncbi:MAG: dihydrolipoamide acetyltransferase family protein [Candidatus Carbobacillus sp.]|nr:dihydrolipoamide acetyltransferase family protein [Candidatus Carbobacillus sp.]